MLERDESRFDIGLKGAAEDGGDAADDLLELRLGQIQPQLQLQLHRSRRRLRGLLEQPTMLEQPAVQPASLGGAVARGDRKVGGQMRRYQRRCDQCQRPARPRHTSRPATCDAMAEAVRHQPGGKERLVTFDSELPPPLPPARIQLPTTATTIHPTLSCHQL